MFKWHIFCSSNLIKERIIIYSARGNELSLKSFKKSAMSLLQGLIQLRERFSGAGTNLELLYEQE
jgi:hypothetical protein